MASSIIFSKVCCNKKCSTFNAKKVWLVGLLLYVGVALGNGQTCSGDGSPVQGSNCKFQTDQGLIDLTGEDQTSGNPAFEQVSGPDGNLYSYNPCTPYTEMQGTEGGQCTGVASCQTVPGSALYEIGYHNTAKCDSDGQGLFITYTATSSYDGGLRTSKVYCKCDQNQEKQFSVDSSVDVTYTMTLTSKYCCPGSAPGGGGGGLSFGSILCILFIVLVTVYLVAGSLFMYFVKGARGAEVIPNSSFWRSLPGLIKDGCLFCFGKVRGKDPTYDEI